MPANVKSAAPAINTRPMQEEALAVFRSGRVAEAMRILDRLPTSDDANSVLLRARVSIALSPAAALSTLYDRRFADSSLRFQAEAMLLRGRAHARLREFATAEECFTAARRFLKQSGVSDRDAFIELDLSIGFLMLDQSRIDEAARVASALYVAHESSHAAAILVLLARVAWHRVQVEKSAAYLLKALQAVCADSNPDVYLWADTLRQLALVSQVVKSATVRDAVMRHVAVLPWTDELANIRAQIYIFLATPAVLDGSITEGLALLKAAAVLPAASLITRVTAILHRANIAQWLGEPLFFEDHLLEATALVKQVDWRSAAPEDRKLLLYFAELHAARDGALALSFAEHFEALGGFDDENADRNPLGTAQRLCCLGVLYTETGEKSKGVGMLQAAYDEYIRLRFDWPAGQIAILLAEATHSILWRTRARKCLVNYPKSFLHKRLASLDRMRDGINRNVRLLTPTQLTIYRRLIDDVPVKVIAARLNRSELTVRNHIQAIFRKFDVTSRSQLTGSTPKPGRRR